MVLCAFGQQWALKIGSKKSGSRGDKLCTYVMVTAAGPLNKLLSLPTFKFLPSSSLSLLRMSFASTGAFYFPQSICIIQPDFCLHCADPFANEGDPLASSQDVGSQSHHLHIRIQQRNGRKTLTTLQGLQKGAWFYLVL